MERRLPLSNCSMKRKFEMKTNYIKPEIEIIVTALGSSFLQESITGITGTIPGDGIDNGGNGDGLAGDINRIYLWDDPDNE